VERQPPQERGADARPAVAGGGEGLDPVAIDGDERELGGDEERRCEDQGSDGDEAERGVQRDLPFGCARRPGSRG
jgi:hypothetical protein